jgi:hypothetical protein
LAKHWIANEHFNKAFFGRRPPLTVAWGKRSAAPGRYRNNHRLAEGHVYRDTTTHLYMAVGQTAENKPAT